MVGAYDNQELEGHFSDSVKVVPSIGLYFTRQSAPIASSQRLKPELRILKP